MSSQNYSERDNHSGPFHHNESLISSDCKIALVKIFGGLWFVETCLNSTSLATWKISETLFARKVESVDNTVLSNEISRSDLTRGNNLHRVNILHNWSLVMVIGLIKATFCTQKSNRNFNNLLDY